MLKNNTEYLFCFRRTLYSKINFIFRLEHLYLEKSAEIYNVYIYSDRFYIALFTALEQSQVIL